MPTAVLGLAHHLPPIQTVDGVRRPIAAEPGGPSDLVLEPSRKALRQAGMRADEIDFIIFATMTPDVTFPGAACYFQPKLGCDTVGAMDIRGQCTGFLMGLMIADAFLQAGVYRRILLAAGEVHSSGLDYSERGLQVAKHYGDGAAAAVLGDDRAAGLEAVVCHTDGRYYDRFWCEYPASRQHPRRVTVEDLQAGRHFPSLDFELVARFGRERLPAVVNEVLSQTGQSVGKVDCFVVSHILPEVAEESALALGIPSSRLVNATVPHGHLTAAALPVALSAAVDDGKLDKGARVCLASCGAGFTWGAALLTL